MEYHTDCSAHRYPGIAKAALEMAYCNGGVNRDRSESAVIRALDKLMSSDGRDVAMDFPAISEWLNGLADDQLQVAVDGEETEREQLMASAPAGADLLLDEIFNNAA